MDSKQNIYQDQKKRVLSKLILPGNIHLPGFTNSIIAATMQLRSDLQDPDVEFSQIHVFHTEESEEVIHSNKDWQVALKESNILNTKNLIHHVTDIEKGENKDFEDLVLQLRDIVNLLDNFHYYIDLSGGRPLLKSILCVFSYVLDIKNIYILEVDFDFSTDFKERKRQTSLYLNQIIEEQIPYKYKRFPEIGLFDNFGKLNLTEIIRYKKLVNEILENEEVSKAYGSVNTNIIKETLLSGINLRLMGEVRKNKYEHFNSIFSFSTAIEEMTNISLQTIFQDYNFTEKKYLSQRLSDLNSASTHSSKYFINVKVLENLAKLINEIRNDVVHPSPHGSKEALVAQLQSNISQHLALNYIQYVSKSVSAFLNKEGNIVAIDEVSPSSNDVSIYYFGFDGDKTGDYIENPLIDGENSEVSEEEVKKRSNQVRAAINKIKNLIKNKTDDPDSVIFAEGDNILFKGILNLDLIANIRETFREKTGLDSSVGYGKTLHEATIALKLAKSNKLQKVMGVAIQSEEK